jgi:hypothetical protein
MRRETQFLTNRRRVLPIAMSRRTFSKLAAAAALNRTTLANSMKTIIPASQLKGRLTADLNSPPVPFNPTIFGQFLGHFHRQVYGGVFDPGSPLADKMGFRLDVVEALREPFGGQMCPDAHRHRPSETIRRQILEHWQRELFQYRNRF